MTTRAEAVERLLHYIDTANRPHSARCDCVHCENYDIAVSILNMPPDPPCPRCTDLDAALEQLRKGFYSRDTLWKAFMDERALRYGVEDDRDRLKAIIDGCPDIDVGPIEMAVRYEWYYLEHIRPAKSKGGA
jgi:hypothetical protein